MLLTFGLLFVSCSINQIVKQKESFDHDAFEGRSITVQKQDDVLHIIGEYTEEQKKHYSEMAKLVDKELCLSNGASFILVLEDDCSRYCSGGHDFYSTNFRLLTQHTVKKGNDSWLCYVYVFTYKCKNCGYYDSVTVHTIAH